MNLKKVYWGHTRDGFEASRYILSNDAGMTVEVSDFGALILAIQIPCGTEIRDVALGFDTLDAYYDISTGFGAYIGRNANRIANGKVTLDGTEYTLEINNGKNNLHSGSVRSHCQFYQASAGKDAQCVWVELTRVSPHMEQGLPGNLNQSVKYTLTCHNELVIDYAMDADKTTVINPTNHSYFNLDGHDSGTILTHTLQLDADAFLPTDEGLIPTGELRAVAGTPMDFRSPKAIGRDIDEAYEPLIVAGGYDHNYCLPQSDCVRNVARLESSDRKVSMTVSTDTCGLQVYSGNFLNGERGKNGAVYQKRSGICFETQFYPNACNDPRFTSSIFAPGEKLESKTVYSFSFANS